MKSQQQDHKISTSCKTCSFAKFEGNKQVSCSFDRIQKFGPSSVLIFDDQDNLEYYKINRVCNYYRNKLWGYSDNNLELVKNESAASFEFQFECDDNPNNNEAIIDFINHNEYYKYKNNFTLIHHNDDYDKVKNSVSNIFSSITHSNKKVDVSVYYDRELYLHSMVQKSEKSYHCIVNNPIQLKRNCDSFINEYINDRMGIIVVANCNDNLFVHNLAYKVLQHFQENLSYTESVNKIIEDAKLRSLYIEI